MNKAQKIAKFKKDLLTQGHASDILTEYMQIERDLYYMIEKITHQKVDDDYYAMKVEMFKEALARDPNYSKKDKK